MGNKLAIIDLGSNSARMIIMKVYEDGSYKMLDQVKEMVRLSEGMGETMTLRPRAIKRTIDGLRLFKKLIEIHEVDQVRLIATAAVRNAQNQQFFLEKVRTETGLEFQVITGEREAYYGYLGVINTIDIADCIIIDVGGASTELTLVENRRFKESISFPFGAVLLSEVFLEKDKISPGKLKKLEEYILEKLKTVPWLSKNSHLPVVGLGGTARTFGKIDKNQIGFPLSSLHNYRLVAKEVYNIYSRVAKADLRQRRAITGINKERADIIVGGMVPIKMLMQYLKAKELIISGNGLREGVFFEQYLKSKQNRILENVLFHSVNNTLKNYHANLKHSYHVQKLALMIFDQTKELHQLGAGERKLLAVGALLHDIGTYVDYYNYHKHGFYLVLNSRLNGLRNRELVLCALIVALHRELEYKGDWRQFQMLIDQKDYEMIKKLSLLVHIAEKLDRSEHGSIEKVECIMKEDTLQLKLKAKAPPDLEIAAALKCKRAFKKYFQKKLAIV